MNERQVPKSLESEKAILGALILDQAIIHEVDGELEPDDFFKEIHKNLYILIRAWAQAGKQVDATLLCGYVLGLDNPQKYGGLAYIAALGDNCGTTEIAGRHAKVVHEKAIRRRMMRSAERLMAQASDSSLEIDELIEGGQKDLLEIASKQRDDDWTDGTVLVEKAQARWEHLAELKALNKSTSLSTGITALDNVLSGLHPGLTLLAARPSMGKTALALNLAVAALEKQVPVAFFSLEMSSGQLVDRMASSLAMVSAWNIKTGNLSDSEWGRLESDALEFIHDAPLHVADKAGITISKIAAQSRRLKGQVPNLGLIIIDYLQLIREPKAENMEQSVSQISGALKTLSRDLNVPVLCLAQLNRGCEQRQNKRPMLSDLRGSGSLEQDADVVMFLYRHAYYNEDADPTEAEVLVTKHRNGATGTVHVKWNANNQKFEDKSAPAPATYQPKTGPVKRARRDVDDEDSDGTWF